MSTTSRRGAAADEFGRAPATPHAPRPAGPGAPPPTPIGEHRREPGGTAGGLWGLARLAAVVAAVVALFVLAGLTPLLIVIVAIIVIVMVHELGHFATAKWSHMKVTEYFIGFGPRLWSIRRGETDYGFKAIPAGGYVKIPGMSNLEEIDPTDEERTYRQQPFHKRIIVASAGSFMHIVMALLLAYGAILYFGAPTSVRIKIAGLTHFAGHARSPAMAAGLKPGDVLMAVDGRRIDSVTAFETTVHHSVGRPLALTVDRHGQTVHLTVTPAAGHLIATTPTTGLTLGAPRGSAKAIGVLGISETIHEIFTPEGPVRAIGTSVIDLGRDVDLTVRYIPEGIHNLYSSLLNAKVAEQSAKDGKRPVSIIGIGRVATQAEQSGILDLIEVLIAINVAFALLNMLPMLPLDGGHVAIAVYERIRTRRGRPYYQADAAKLMPVAYGFMAVLMVIVISAVYLDIAYPVRNPFH
jgi:membrane-associated protease RseP (regulator of RpoE activity)